MFIQAAHSSAATITLTRAAWHNGTTIMPLGFTIATGVTATMTLGSILGLTAGMVIGTTLGIMTGMAAGTARGTTAIMAGAGHIAMVGTTGADHIGAVAIM